MNILALSVQAYGTPEIVVDVPASCFSPRPKVDSAILKISKISEDFFTRQRIAPKDFFALIKAGFSSRRKMLANNLQSFASKKELIQALNSIGHSSNARAQELSLEEWAKLTRQHLRPDL
jgi:16S rRNA (adenine1518-N6/adenine1519-N6)-dimethyltransferase